MKTPKTFTFTDVTANPHFNFHQGSTLYHKTARDSRGEPARAKVTSIKTWKTKPGFEVHMKYGLYNFWTITTTNELENWAIDYEHTN